MMNNEVPQQHWKLNAHLLTRLYTRLKEAPRCAAAKQTIHGVVLLISSTDVPDGWTSTPRGKDDEKNCSEHDETSSQPLVKTGGEEDAHDNIKYTGCGSSCDLRAGERLPKQRPLGDEHPECCPEEHLGAQKFLQVGEAGSIVLQFSRSLSVLMNESKEMQETTSAAAKKKDECVDKDAEILRLIEERRKMPKEERHRLKELSKK